jgi:predicted nucleic acid-binding protein
LHEATNDSNLAHLITPVGTEAKELLNKIENGNFSAVTSVLTLVEVACTTSRAYERYNHKLGEVSINADKRHVELPALFALALEIGSKTGVKTLDTLHLASAANAARIYGQKIDYFVTLDDDILKRQETINNLIESRVVSLSEKL